MEERIPEKEKRVDACRFACIIMDFWGQQIYTSYSGLGAFHILLFWLPYSQLEICRQWDFPYSCIRVSYESLLSQQAVIWFVAVPKRR